MMKSVLKLVVMVMALSSLPRIASADWSCVEVTGGKSGAAAKLILEVGNDQSVKALYDPGEVFDKHFLMGQEVSQDDSPLGTRTVYDLNAGLVDGKLTLAAFTRMGRGGGGGRGGLDNCGRAGCDVFSTDLSAVLNFGSKEVEFTCQQAMIRLVSP